MERENNIDVRWNLFVFGDISTLLTNVRNISTLPTVIGNMSAMLYFTIFHKGTCSTSKEESL